MVPQTTFDYQTVYTIMDFLVNEVPYDEEKTDSIVNMGNYNGLDPFYSQRIIDECWWYDRKFFELMKSVPEERRDPKSLFKYVFGRQLTCKNYTNRNWVWTFSDLEEQNAFWTLISTTGVSWEFDSTSEDFHRVIDLRKKVENYIYETASS